MFKFNSDNILSGYIKQLLASFNLPKCKVYTAEQAKAVEETGKELNVLMSIPRNTKAKYPNNVIGTMGDGYTNYDLRMRYIPYIKDGELQIYAPDSATIKSDGSLEYSGGKWRSYHADYGNGHEELHGNAGVNYVARGYSYGIYMRNLTKTLKVKNNVYDTYTHEYLGDYLRFQRDYANVDLMPLYNCFSNRLCPRIDVRLSKDGFTTSFDSSDARYKIYMLPIRLFQKYTIAIDSGSDVEVCCGLYGQYQYGKDFDAIMKDTYKCFNGMRFAEPELYDPTKALAEYLKPNHSLELSQKERDLKLFIKLPASCKSSITVLEGDYRDWQYPTLIKYYSTDDARTIEVDDTVLDMSLANQSLMFATVGENDTVLDFVSDDEYRYSALTINESTAGLATSYWQPYGQDDKSKMKLVCNHAMLNTAEGDPAENAKHLITPLQLLMANTGVSYPFADRLIEYLVGNAITPQDEITDDIRRAKTVINHRTGETSPYDGIWEDEIRQEIYSFIMERDGDKRDMHDVLGYVDKDAEKLYSVRVGKDRHVETISNIDIYGTWED